MLLRDVCLQMVACAEFQDRLRKDVANVKLEEEVMLPLDVASLPFCTKLPALIALYGEPSFC